MTLPTKLVETDPSFFEEELEKPVWVDEIVEEYEFIMKKNVWEVVPILANKLVVGLRWILKVKDAADKIIEKYTTIFVTKGFS